MKNGFENNHIQGSDRKSRCLCKKTWIWCLPWLSLLLKWKVIKYSKIWRSKNSKVMKYRRWLHRVVQLCLYVLCHFLHNAELLFCYLNFFYYSCRVSNSVYFVFIYGQCNHFFKKEKCHNNMVFIFSSFFSGLTSIDHWLPKQPIWNVRVNYSFYPLKFLPKRLLVGLGLILKIGRVWAECWR